MPLYPVYALLFADHGLSVAAISSLYVFWTVTSFLLEVPSGAWADLVPRRLLLVASCLLKAAAFGLWVLVPSYPAFAAGFVLWGVSSALSSGSFEALAWDVLAARGRTERYQRLQATWTATRSAAMLLTTLSAVPLVSAGGYALAGAVSVGLGLVGAAVAATLPEPRTAAPAPTRPAGTTGAAVRAYAGLLVAGVREAAADPVVRRLLVLEAALAGLISTDEYVSLLARVSGTPTVLVPLWEAGVVAAETLAAALLARVLRVPPRLAAVAVAVAAAVFAAGSLWGVPLAAVPVAVAYGLLQVAVVATGSRLQHAIRGPARATVTSVGGLLQEAAALVVVAVVGAASLVAPLPVILAALAVPLAVLALAVPRSLADRSIVGGRH